MAGSKRPSITRREILKGAIALPLLGGEVTGNVATGTGAPGAAVGEDIFMEGLGSVFVESGPRLGNLTREMWDTVSDILRKRFREAYAERDLDNGDNLPYGILATCYICRQDDFSDKVPQRGHPIWAPICDDCFPDLGSILEGMLE